MNWLASSKILRDTNSLNKRRTGDRFQEIKSLISNAALFHTKKNRRELYNSRSNEPLMDRKH
jgi:hypothetical protein